MTDPGRPKNGYGSDGSDLGSTTLIRWQMIYFCCISGVILFSKTCAFNFYLCSAAPVLQLKAVDQDNSSTPAGQIVFSIVSTHNKFTIDPKTGWLATNKVNEG